MAWAIKDNNKGVTREKCVCDDKGNLTTSDEAMLHAWKEDYQRLLYVEFPWEITQWQLKDLLYLLQRIW